MGRRSTILAAAGVALALAAPARADESDGKLSIVLNAGRLADALQALSVKSRVGLLFSPAVVGDRRSPRVSGTGSIERILRALLAGSGLSFRRTEAGTIIIFPSPAVAPADISSRAEEIIVTASPRAGTLKRDGDTVVNTVTELEVRRLPNLDLSDVLARLPGVRRNETQSGESRYVQIRGLNNAAASQSIDGVLLTNYINSSRAASTELLPSSFVKNIVITTTVTPDLDENSNAGHVALTTIGGLDGDGRHLLELRALGGANSHSDGVVGTRRPVRASATWRGTLDADGRIGLAASAGIDRLGSRQNAVSVAGFTDVGGALVPNGTLTRGETYTNTQRISAVARLDLRPSDRLALFAEYFYLSHHFTTDQRTSSVTVAAADARILSGETGQFDGAGATIGFNHAESPLVRDHIVQAGIDHDLGGDGTISARFGATFNRVKARSIATSGFSAPTATLAIPVGYRFANDRLELSPGVAALLADPANYRLGGRIVVSDIASHDRNLFGRIDVARNAGPGDRGFGIKAGAQIKTLDRTNRQRGYARILPAGQSIGLAEVTGASTVAMFDPIDWNRDRFLALVERRGIPSPDANRLYEADPADGYGQDFSGTERITDLYGIASYAIGRARLSAGLRAAQTHRTLDQFEPDAIGRWGERHYDQSYWHLLPSLHGSFDLSAQVKLRGAFTRTLERPAIASASRRLITSYDTPVTRSISYSDPYLRPIRSTNFDASVEYYHGSHDAYLSIGGFSRYLRDIPAVSSRQSIAADGVREIVTYTSNVTTVNGSKVYGRSQGIEMVWSDPQIRLLPRRFGNLGAMLSYDYIVYRTTAIDGGGGVAASDTRLVDAGPRHYFNASLFYNRGPLAANLFVQEISSVPVMSYDPANDRRTKYDPLIDVQLSYAIATNARLVVEARNLLDQDIVDRYGVTGYAAAQQTRNNGRTLWIGAQFTLF